MRGGGGGGGARAGMKTDTGERLWSAAAAS